jgi:4-hydroxybenzoate polyprenyltransferase
MTDNISSTPIVKEASPFSFNERLRVHFEICRLDHSIKDVFVLPGVAVPLRVIPSLLNYRLIATLLLAFVSITLAACSNYDINEALDAPFGQLRPIECKRPAALGVIHSGAAYIQRMLMMAVGILIGIQISRAFVITAFALWIMGCFYNIPQFRTKEVVYPDEITQSENNPLRMPLGWYAVTRVLKPPVSLLISYWAIGC